MFFNKYYESMEFRYLLWIFICVPHGDWITHEFLLLPAAINGFTSCKWVKDGLATSLKVNGSQICNHLGLDHDWSKCEHDLEIQSIYFLKY